MDFTRQNSNSKYYIFNYKNNSNFNIGYPSDYRENQNKSAYSNYLNLNKSLSYYKCNEISNCSSCQINNFNPYSIFNRIDNASSYTVVSMEEWYANNCTTR